MDTPWSTLESGASSPIPPWDEVQSLESSSALNQTVTLREGSIECSIKLPRSLLSRCLQLSKKFQDIRAQSTTIAGDPSRSPIELFSKFTQFIIDSVFDESNAEHPDIPLLREMVTIFRHKFLGDENIHAAVASNHNDIPTQRSIIRTFLKACSLTGSEHSSSESRLLVDVRNDNARLMALFNGQGVETYFEELLDSYKAYRDVVVDLVSSLSGCLMYLAEDAAIKDLYPEGLNVHKWLDTPEARPNNEYLLSAPVSVPLIGLSQLLSYAITCINLKVSPGEFRRYLSGAAGHSQGVIVAAFMASVDSWESFNDIAKKVMQILLRIGCRTQQYSRDAPVSNLCTNGEAKVSSRMLSVKGGPKRGLQKHIDELNKYLPETDRVSIALNNGRQQYVVAGPLFALQGLQKKIADQEKQGPQNIARIPFSQRKPVVGTRLLPITVPFHSLHLKAAEEQLQQDLASITLAGSDLAIPVFHTETAENLQSSGNVIPQLIRMICIERVNWENVVNKAFEGVTHVLDFGPGGDAGIGNLVSQQRNGTGLQTIVVTADSGSNPALSYAADLYSCKRPVQYKPIWGRRFSPELVQSLENSPIVSTKFSRLLGLPPVMVAGMTPTTTSYDFVAAIMNAGYHAELGCGGFHNAASMERGIRALAAAIAPGRGITCNLIYANPRAMAWQIPLLAKLRQSGIPITGLTIGAGVPSPEVVSGYIKDLSLTHISLKPGSKEAIDSVLAIARTHPDFPIILQWTGGRAGGHHSYEDFHQPILDRYGKIRSQDNIILIAGSGFGGAEDTYPYMTGSWSLKFDRPPMPFDGILLGSRVMTAKEAHTSPAAKIAITKTPGVPDQQWEGTYKEPTGGILTVRSEMGEPIHKLATRGVKLWAELDRDIFSLPREQQREKLQQRKDYFIKRLNEDFQKVWFGLKAQGTVSDLYEMTYFEVLERLVDLLYLKDQRDWIDPSFRTLVWKYTNRLEERLCQSAIDNEPFLKNITQLDNPHKFMTELSTRYPQASVDIITASDAEYFILLCRQPGQKPVPFILTLDEDFEYWFKKDSLWQSERIEAVPGQDVERTCILHGPVAAQYANVVDEPVKDILDGIHNAHISWILRDQYKGDTKRVTEPERTEYGNQNHVESIRVDLGMDKSSARYSLNDDAMVPTLNQWLASIGGPYPTWKHSIFNAHHIVHGRKIIENPIRRLFTPKPGRIVEVLNPGSDTDEEIILKESNHMDGKQNNPVASACLKRQMNGDIILSLLHQATGRAPVKLNFQFEYKPAAGTLSIHEKIESREARIKQFYQDIWISDTPLSSEALVFQSEPATLDCETIVNFAKCIRNQNPAYTNRQGEPLYAPLDLAIVIAWKPMMSCLFPKCVTGDMLRLLHLSNEFKLCDGALPLQEGDQLSSEGRLKALKIKKGSGKVVRAEGKIFRNGSPIIHLKSEFILLGDFTDYCATFDEKEETVYIHLNSIKDIVLLKSRRWFVLHENVDLKDYLHKLIEFNLTSQYSFQDANSYSRITVRGSVVHKPDYGEPVILGFVNFSGNSYIKNPVTDYLQRHGGESESPETFSEPRRLLHNLEVEIPDAGEEYAQVSADINPIHLSELFAHYAGHETRVTHGMFTSGLIRGLVEHHVACNDPSRMRSWECMFEGKVCAGDRLSVDIYHVGMSHGKMLLTVTAHNVATDIKVLSAKSELQQPSTAYVFTGQGSQQAGMGMELHKQSPAARRVWETADEYFLRRFGFSIVDIVRTNPMELTVRFGGTRGRSVRENYIALTFDSIDENGVVTPKPVFPEIDRTTRSYTFKSADGLLHETQFTQPALVLMELARFADMESKGVIKKDSLFAGHSLGEYVALTAMGELFSVDEVAELVFYRGLSMQNAVERNADGTTDYSMCAINPSRVGRVFHEDDLHWCVTEVARQTGGLLEIVNYNIVNMQYVCAGDLRSLAALTMLTDFLTAEPSGMADRSKLQEKIKSLVVQVDKMKRPIVLQRGKAAIPLKVNVPFHSSLLKPRVDSFRRFLERTVSDSRVKPERLVGKYIPNLIAKPFQLSKEYIKGVYAHTHSPVLEKVLRDMEATTGDALSALDRCGHSSVESRAEIRA
ncbi:predicted protein [Uncinocarpus reesii 1704]|uniref:Malonyl-CoA:ACP transacylase (MAT) domain-containing protein n=1 Tax=Uncinocarpus reesii (strain UAMH 1704) TaxID=336963 RepID=C4JNY8_UNCRE|nr:uncharacterized protein UREG_04458 [Uncinocarpus reesii 1704]EEP79612.1 predicted protein [Uncinocarpus reesii 1704]